MRIRQTRARACARASFRPRGNSSKDGCEWQARYLSDASTYDPERVAKRKDESADAYDGGVGRQERNGGEKVQEGRVCSEALYRNHQSPALLYARVIFRDDARYILHPSRDSGDLHQSVRARRWGGILQDGNTTTGHAPILRIQRPHWEQWCARSGLGLQQMRHHFPGCV